VKRKFEDNNSNSEVSALLIIYIYVNMMREIYNMQLCQLAKGISKNVCQVNDEMIAKIQIYLCMSCCRDRLLST